MPKFLALFVCAALLAVPEVARALPQFSVRSSRMCSNCHIAPTGWDNPDVSERKCSLGCGTCHVNPTGGGMRAVGGRFYGREILAMFGDRPSLRVPPPKTPASRPAGDSQPELQDDYAVPTAGSSERYGYIDSMPWIQVGADVRMMLYGRDDESLAVFPMQADLYVAGSPYNPEKLNEGRLTLLVNAGFRGSRAEEFDGFIDRAFVREWWALAHDWPYQAYAKVGRFMPAFGWRLDDHSAFIRQEQSFGAERQVTGVEVGLNPNYLYAHASLFNPASAWDKPIDKDAGIGTALSAGYRELLWQAGGSFMFESRDDASELWAGANWSINLHDARDFHRFKGLDWIPLIYMGQFDYRRRSPADGGRVVNGLTAFHELDFLILEGLNFKARYDWQDPDLDLRDDHRHRYTVGLEFHPYTFIEVIAQYRRNVLATGDDFNEAFLQLHGFFF